MMRVREVIIMYNEDHNSNLWWAHRILYISSEVLFNSYHHLCFLDKKPRYKDLK